MYAQAVVATPAVLGAAIVLPNTGNNRLMAVVAMVTLVVGVAIIVTTFARVIAKKAFKA